MMKRASLSGSVTTPVKIVKIGRGNLGRKRVIVELDGQQRDVYEGDVLEVTMDFSLAQSELVERDGHLTTDAESVRPS